MKRNVSRETAARLKKSLRKKRWQKMVTCMAAVVVFFTTYALILPALTLEKETYCGLAEHQHSKKDGCYGETLICGFSDDGEQTEETSSDIQVIHVSDEEAEEHVHDDSCYELICEQPEHVHSLSCYSNPEADVETAEKWEKTFAKVKLSGDWKEDTAAIADSQIGYAESEDNYDVAKNSDGEEVKKGYSRYGAWYGKPYGDWNAMFAEFCLSYSGAQALPFDPSYTTWIGQLQSAEVWETADGYEPQTGDLIFLDKNENQAADHVGIVASYDADKQTAQVIEGDAHDRVEENKYSLAETAVVGYCNMTSAMEKFADAEPAEQEISTDDAETERTLEYTGEDYKVTAHVPKDANLPEGVEMKVRELSGDEYDEKLAEAKEAMKVDDVTFARFFDISFFADGTELEPEAPVQIEITYQDEKALENVDETTDSVTGVVHFADKGTEVLDTETAQNDDGETTFTFTQDSFSVTGTVVGGPRKAKGNVPGTVTTVDSRSDGITLNLFDYWIGNSDKPEDESKRATSTYDNPNITGINTGKYDHTSDLQFYDYGTEGTTINNYPSSQKPNPNIVQPGLGSDGYPTLTTNNSSLKYLFDLNNNNGNGKRVYADVNHLFQKDENGYYWYNSDTNYAEYNQNTKDFTIYNGTYRSTCENGKNYMVGFFPFNEFNSNETCVKNFAGHDGGSHGAGKYYNHHLGMTMEAQFQLPESRQVNGQDIVFSYSGDDDMWVYIDDVLVLNVGGLHEPAGGTINFKTGAVELAFGDDTTIEECFRKAGKTWKPDQVHTIKAFYLERGGCYSNLAMNFNLPVIKKGRIEVTKTLDGTATKQYANKDFNFNLQVETAQNSGKYQNYTGKATKVDAKGNKTEIDVVDGNFTLKADEKLWVDELNDQLKYIVKETGIDGNIVSHVKVANSKTEKTISSGEEELATDPAMIKDRIKTEFINTTKDVPMELNVKKQWKGGRATVKPDVQVQLYRKETVSQQKAAQKHKVTIAFDYEKYDNQSQKRSNVASKVVEVPHGGTLQFYVDSEADQNIGIKRATATSGSLQAIDPASGEKYFDGNGPFRVNNNEPRYHTKQTYKLSNVTQDTNITVLLQTYYFNAGLRFDPDQLVQNVQIKDGTGIVTEDFEQIVPVNGVETLNAGTDWMHKWENLPRADAEGRPYTYYIREVNVPEGFEASYSSNATETVDGNTVYEIDDNQTLTIKNTSTNNDAISVEKIWSDGQNGHDPIQVQLYHKTTEQVEKPGAAVPQKTHTVKVNVVYKHMYNVYNAYDSTDINREMGTYEIQVPDGGSVACTVDTSADNQAAVTYAYKSSGNAQFDRTAWSGDNKNFRNDNIATYPNTTHTFSNVTSDVTAVIECSTRVQKIWQWQWPDANTYDFKANFSWGQVKNADGSNFDPTPQPVYEDVEVIAPYGNEETLNANGNWKHTWSNLPFGEYYIREIDVPNGYDVTYSSQTTKTAKDGKTVYLIDDDQATFTITNTRQTHEVTIPVAKVWADNGDHSETVYLALCDKDGKPILCDSEGRPVEKDGTAQLVKLDKSTSNWKTNFIIKLPNDKNLNDMGYTIREVYDTSTDERQNYTKAVVQNDNKSTLYFKSVAKDGGLVLFENTGYVVRYSTDSEGTLVATNSSAEKLPETGGAGTTRYVLGGLALMLASTLYGYITIRRRREGGLS